MTRYILLLRTIRYFRAANAAVVAGMAVATAVLTGALMVGDSVGKSLEQLAAQRLGRVDFAMTGPRFVEESLAGRIAHTPGFDAQFAGCVPALIIRGGASISDPPASTGGVQIAAVGGNWIPVAPDQCLINSQLAEALGISTPGASILLPVPRLEATPRDSTLARRSWNDTTNQLRARVSGIAVEPGMASMFNLQGGQRLPRNAWVNLADLQDVVDQPGRVNTIFVEAKSQERPHEQAAALNARLRQAMTLADYGSSVSHVGDEAVLSASGTYIVPPIDQTVETAATTIGITPRRVSAYLINTAAIIPTTGQTPSEIHYAIAVGISSLDNKPLAPDEIALNAWAAEHLNAKVGDTLRLDYYTRQPSGELADVRSDRPGVGLTFRIAKILPMTGLGADPSLTPVYKGLTDSPTMEEWDAPKGITINKQWITKADEAYWKQYRTAPKFFLNLETAHKLWGSAYGDITSIRIPSDKADLFTAELLHRLDPAALGLAFRAVKADQIAASGGGSEFAMTFVSFSFFLIAAALLLVAMLFRLSIEQRARQLGLLAAVGFSPRRLRSMAVREGMLLALVGGLIGIAASIGYTWLMMAGLRTWWFGAVGTTQLRLHVEPMTLAYGLVSSLVIAWLAILWGVWRVGRTEAVRLLNGAWTTSQIKSRHAGRIAGIIALGCCLMGLLLMSLGLGHLLAAQEAFLGSGALLLVAGLSGLTGRLRRGGQGAQRIADSLGRLSLRNASRHPGRSVLAAALIASATFILVIVAGMRQQRPADVGDLKSGAGGYRLMLQADIPLLGDLGTPSGRGLLGIRSKPDDPIWSQAKFMSLRRWAGQDVSCLNMTQPTDPTILAVGSELVQRNAFTFAGTIRKTDNPWTLLDDVPAPDGAVPIIADANTADYILHVALGQELTLHDGSGAPVQAKLVATLAGSIFQSELLMSETNFRRLYPEQSGYGVVLIDVPAAQSQPLEQLLGGELEAYAVTVESTSSRLAMYNAVANTYLSTFQTLGSLGLLLGTIGLAVVLLRALVERKAELAMLAALGWSRVDRLRLVLMENVFLLLIGLGLGVASAFIAVAPVVIGSGRQVEFVGLAATLAGVFATGLIVLVAAVWLGGRNITPADLRAE